MTSLASPSRPDQPDRDTLMARSARLVGLFEQHYRALSTFISPLRVREYGKRLSRLEPDMWTGAGEQAILPKELAMWTAEKARSTALERYACQTPMPAASNEASVLAGMRESVISFWQVDERHPVAGWMLRDLVHEGAAWIVDARLDESLAEGDLSFFLARLFRTEPDGFWMGCGLAVPVPSDVAKYGLGQAGKNEVRSGSDQHARLSRQSSYITLFCAEVLPWVRC